MATPIPLDASAVAKFDDQKKYFSVADFKIGGKYNFDNEESYDLGGEGGKTFESLDLPPVQIGYITLGEPKRDKDGKINNAILLCPYYSGDSTNMLDFWSPDGGRTDFAEGVYLGPGKVIDTDKYYVILADALGLWGSSKPSSSHPGKENTVSLGLDFPEYRLEDCVQLMYRLLRDELGVESLELVTGVSLGAALTYVFGVMHPNFVKRIMPIGGTHFQNRGMARWLFDLMTAAIQSDVIYRETAGAYYDRPRLKRPILGNLFGWSLVRQSAFVDEYRVEQTFDQYSAEAFDWQKSQAVLDTEGEDGWGKSLYSVALMDSNDLIYRNIAQSRHDVEPELHRVTAKTLIIHVETDQWLPLHIAKRAQERIKGAKLLTFPHDMGHYAVFSAPGRYAKEIGEFLS